MYNEVDENCLMRVELARNCVKISKRLDMFSYPSSSILKYLYYIDKTGDKEIATNIKSKVKTLKSPLFRRCSFKSKKIARNYKL